MDFEILCNPEKYGYEPCHFCNGYGSSFKEPNSKCSVCGGSGLLKKKGKTNDRQKKK